MTSHITNALRGEFRGFHLEGENDTILSGNHAHYLTFSFIKNSTAFSGITIYNIIGDRIYDLEAITPDTNIGNVLPTFIIMRDSFSIYQTNMSNSTDSIGNSKNDASQFFGYRG